MYISYFLERPSLQMDHSPELVFLNPPTSALSIRGFSLYPPWPLSPSPHLHIHIGADECNSSFMMLSVFVIGAVVLFDHHVLMVTMAVSCSLPLTVPVIIQS